MDILKSDYPMNHKIVALCADDTAIAYQAR